MGIISTLKTILGIGGRDRDDGPDAAVTVEREPDAGTERAVKEPSSAAEDATADADHEPATDEDEAAAAAEGDAEPVETVKGIGPAYADRLADAGVETVADLAAADAATLSEATDIAQGRIDTWIERANAR